AAAQRALPPGVVHRDVTPHNVLVSTEGEVKLADFGIARALDRETWTACGRVKGKVDFLSPEQLSGDQLDVRSDLFAVGVLLYELLCGVRPFRRASDTLTLEAIRLGQYLPLSAQARHLPSRLVMTVERFLQRDPSLRPRTADAAADLLAHSADEHQASVELRRLASGFWADRQPCAAPNRYQDGVTEGTGTRRQGRGALSSLEVTAR
ncbi:MAG TPA: serine/threonine-protein kinase, partial [Polyangiaceae bacterium]